MNYFFLLTLFVFSKSVLSQINFERHIESIKKDYYESEDKQGVFNANERAVDYALKYLEDNSIQEKYITNRKLLTKVEAIKCKDSSNIYFYKKLENKTVINIKVKFKRFKVGSKNRFFNSSYKTEPNSFVKSY